MQKTTTLLLTFALVMAFGQQANAQNNFKEVGTRFSDFDNFGIIYKKQLDENKYKRYNLAFTNIGVLGGAGETFFNAGVNFGMGWEERSELSDKLKFIHGFNPAVSIAYSSTGNNVFVVNLSLGYMLGLQYDISKELYVSVEAIPGLNLNGSFADGRSNVLGANVSGGNQNAAITLAYRFRKD